MQWVPGFMWHRCSVKIEERALPFPGAPFPWYWLWVTATHQWFSGSTLDCVCHLMSPKNHPTFMASECFIISSSLSTTSHCPLVKWAKRKCQEPSWVNRAGLRLNGENPGSYWSSWFPNISHHAAQPLNTTQEHTAWLWRPLKFSTEDLKGFV